MHASASPVVLFGIPGLALVALSGVLVAVWHATRDARLTRRLALGLAGWLLYTGTLAGTGLAARTDLGPLPMATILLPMVIACVVLARSSIGTALIERLPLAALIGFHAFRLPLELVMHQAAAEGVMPPQMTFGGEGMNYDIVSGLLALAIGLGLAIGIAPRWTAWLFNIIGSALLLTIVGIAIASLPLIHAFGTDPAHVNTWVTQFPFIWLPTGLVSSALFGHLLLWRHLLADRR